MTDVDEIKNRLDIVDFISHYITLKKAGSNYKGLCPFHDERTPSFMVSPEKQIFKCFGCGESGDVISFLQKHENLEFREALEVLAEKAGVRIQQPATNNKIQATNKFTLYSLNLAAAQLWHKILFDHPAGGQALQILRQRKISDQTAKKFLMGFAPSQDTTRAFLAQRGFTPDQIKAAGSPGKFFKRIMFPLFDALGNIIGFTGRASYPGQEPKYLNTPEVALFHKSRYLYGLHLAKQAIKSQDQAIVVEGQMDVIGSHQAGVANVVAASGTALTQDHLRLLARYTDNIVFAFDADPAGVKATQAALANAIDLDLSVRIIPIPEGSKDVGEVVEHNPALWQSQAQLALPWLEWLIGNYQLANKKNQLSSEKIKKVAKEILPFLAKVKDPIERSYWVKELARLLNVKEQAVADALARVGSTASHVQIVKNPPQILSVKEELYGLLAAFPDNQKTRAKLYNGLKNWYDKDSKQLELQIQQKYQGVSTADISRAIDQIIARLGQDQRQKIKDDFARQIAQAESQGDLSAVKNLFRDLQEELKK